MTNQIRCNLDDTLPKIPANDFAGLKFTKMHGHTKIILHDVKTGIDEIHEDDNLVTLAVPKIYKTNWLGLARFDKIMPFRDLFGGVLCFRDPLTESTATMYPQNKDVNPMIANAGQTAYSGPSTTRGTPNGIASEIDPSTRTVKFVWDWPLESGNGQISAVCLTSAAAGDASLLPDGSASLWDAQISQAINDTNQFYGNVIGGLNGAWSETMAKRCPVAFNDDGDGICVYLDGTTFKEYTIRHPWFKSGLIEEIPMNVETNYYVKATRTATTSRTFATSYYQIGQDASNYYIIEVDSSDSTKLHVDTISKTDMTVTGSTLTVSGVTFARRQIEGAQHLGAIISNGSAYVTSGSDSKTLVRVNLTNAADVEELTSYMTNNISLNQMPFVANNGLVLGHNYLINGDTVYPVAERAQRIGGMEINQIYNYQSIAAFQNSPHVFQGIGPRADGDRRYSEGGLLFLPYLATVNNLSNPVTKNNTRTLRIEYTLTEV